MKRTVALITGGLVAAGVAAWWVIAPQSPPPRPLPTPAKNSYDVFVAAAVGIDPATDNWEEIDEAVLAQIVDANAEAVADVRAALDGESVVPIEPAVETMDPVQAALDRVNGMTRVGRAFLAASRRAELAGEAAAQAELLVDLLRFSQAASRGGLVIDHLKGVAYAETALQRLAELTSVLDERTVRTIVRNLDRQKLPAEDAATIVDREIALMMQRHNAMQRIALGRIVDSQRQQSLKQLGQAQQRVAVAAAVLRIRLGLRLFELENGRLPRLLAELVPEYLRELPVDPVSRKSFVYQVEAEGDAYLLHGPAADASVDRDEADAVDPERATGR